MFQSRNRGSFGFKSEAVMVRMRAKRFNLVNRGSFDFKHIVLLVSSASLVTVLSNTVSIS